MLCVEFIKKRKKEHVWYHSGFSDFCRNPFVDLESPRTRRMRREYESRAFPTSAAEVEMIHGLQDLEILVRNGGDDGPGALSG